MKRLTERNKNGTAMAACCGENCKYNFCCENGGFAECGDMDDIIDRLATIEDILGDEYDLDEHKEVVQAKREGRCVVLPKDGMVYYIEEAGGEKWIGNKPIQQVVLRCGFGMALLEFSLFDTGKYFSRAEAEAALRREQD